MQPDSAQNERPAYRGIMKGTAIFGGVQVFSILINIIRGKFIALFLGPAGMGISALLTSTVNLINQFSSMGLSVSAVRDISMAHNEGDLRKLSQVVIVFRRLVFITAILGALISVLGARLWSKIAFGNYDNALSFVILAAMLFFTALASAEIALLQGKRQLKDLAKTSLIGSLVGLIVGVPMYYFWGVSGIAPAMVALALVMYLSNRYFTSKIVLVKLHVTQDQTMEQAKKMIALGVTLTIAAIIGALSVYFINWYIRSQGGIEDVGLYQAATSITTQYIGLVFSAMAVDYFPRLSSISQDNNAVRKMANQQAEMVMLISTPIIIALLLTAPIVVRLLLSVEFLPVIPVLRWMGFALFFKAASYSLGYIALSKGDKRVFFWLEGVLGNILLIVCNVMAYALWGFVGLGIATLITYFLYFIIVSVVVYKRYQFKFTSDFIRMFLYLAISVFITFLLYMYLENQILATILVAIIFLAVSIYCFFEINKRINIKDFIRIKFSKINKE